MTQIYLIESTLHFLDGTTQTIPIAAFESEIEANRCTTRFQSQPCDNALLTRQVYFVTPIQFYPR